MLVVNDAAVLKAVAGATPARCCGFQGRKALGAFDDVGQQQGDKAEDEHGDGVLLPTHLLVRLDTAGAVQKPLNGPEHRIEKCLLPFKDPGDIETQGAHQKQQHREEHHKLQPTIGGHF